ncbi:50S ribosomal protein L19e [Candidatus Woesearchaeota archaeon]|nr:50S ribosomal protein L19e [Candidatus Woesearchaeota archaeon]
MKLKLQKKLAADVMDCSPKRVWFDEGRLEEIKEAITKADIRRLVKDRAIGEKPIRGISRARANKIKIQKSKGRQKGHGSRKGKKGARLPRKEAWMFKIRKQRDFLMRVKLSGKVSVKDYRLLYLKAKGGFFRSLRHMKLYIDEHGMFKK